jgi:hypothetical protein
MVAYAFGVRFDALRGWVLELKLVSDTIVAGYRSSGLLFYLHRRLKFT